MGKINKDKKSTREIRLVFDLKNKRDLMLYEKYSDYSQPGRIIKKILEKNMDNEESFTEKNYQNSNSELLEVLKKLSDKIDNLAVVNKEDKKEKSSEENISDNQISLTAEVSSDDLDDIEF